MGGIKSLMEHLFAAGGPQSMFLLVQRDKIGKFKPKRVKGRSNVAVQ